MFVTPQRCSLVYWFYYIYGVHYDITTSFSSFSTSTWDPLSFYDTQPWPEFQYINSILATSRPCPSCSSKSEAAISVLNNCKVKKLIFGQLDLRGQSFVQISRRKGPIQINCDLFRARKKSAAAGLEPRTSCTATSALDRSTVAVPIIELFLYPC